MKGFVKISLTVALAACLTLPAFTSTTSASAATTATGYTCAEDVQYVTKGKYIYNWGARGEDATFLSTYAQSFYTGSYVYSVLSDKEGGSGQSDAPQSDLYKALQTLMSSKQTDETTYGDTRYQYCYTDCEKGGGAISCFYTKKEIGPSWDSGATWNREHVWPASKSTAGSRPNNGEAGEGADIMMLRPTDSKTNSGRGNKAYGEGSGFYDPDKYLTDGDSVRGDCARIMLYIYVRWGNTSKMWGSNGVIESLPILLKWMEEDPVDTWEMGRNDAVQAITGTRNVFVDYPEYAWLLFGEAVPADVVTPSGNEDSSKPSQNECEHVFGEWTIVREPTEEKDGVRSHTCTICGFLEAEKIPRPNTGDENLIEMPLFSCMSTVISPISFTIVLASAYVLGRKKEK